jgi:ferredoxin
MWLWPSFEARKSAHLRMTVPANQPFCALANSARIAIIAGEARTRDRQRGDMGNAKMAAKLKIHVDQDKCQGHARCKSLAPELFDLDEFGNAHEVGDGTVPEGLEDKAWLAQANCPEIAIDVVEE